MNHLSPFLALATLLALAGAGAGCHSHIVNLKQQINPTYQARTFADIDQRQAYDASLAALRQMGYRQTGGGAAQGRIEAISEMLGSGTPQQSPRQVAIAIRISPTLEGGANVETLFTDIRQDAFNSREGMGSKQPLAESPLYDVFYKHLARAASMSAPPPRQPISN
ncbi:MAG: hypothetical protein LBI02_04495 [Opitutaceae bacterium]|jgi:hypothetical protein|nr:hypothetical protein [Opitutaceae bacterium]